MIAKGTSTPYYNERGVLVMGAFDFLLNAASLEQSCVKGEQRGKNCAKVEKRTQKVDFAMALSIEKGYNK